MTAEDAYLAEVARLLDFRATSGRDLPTAELMVLQAREEAQQGRVDRAHEAMLESPEADEARAKALVAPRSVPGPWSPMYWDLRS